MKRWGVIDVERALGLAKFVSQHPQNFADLYPDYNRAGGHAMIVCRRRTEQATALAVSGLQGQYLVEKEMMNEQAAALRHRVQELLGECRVCVCEGLSARICDTASMS